MVSPVQLPPPPPRPLRPHRSLAGPVVLIVVGIVFLLGTMGVWHWFSLVQWFGHYWPVLLIVWGVIKLVEYEQAKRTGTRPSGIGAGGVFLLIVLVVFGLLATQAVRFNWDELRDQINRNGGDFPMFGHAYNFDDQLQQAFPTGANLHVVNDHGAVNLTASTDEQIHVAIHKRVNAESQEEADKWNAGSKPQIAVNGNDITLNANTQGAGDHWITTDLDVSVPRKASVVISTRHGDASVLGRDGDANVSCGHGDVSVSDIKGKVSLNLDHSSARVSQVASDVTVEGRANDVSIEDVKGSVHLNGDFTESVKLAKIAKTVSFKTARTDMEFSKLDGDLDLDSGDLEVNEVTGPARLQTRSKDIRVNGVSGDLRLEDENGAVEVHVNKLGSMQVDNRQGDIEIYLPDKSSFQVDAHARNGEIHSDFGELKINNTDDEGTATGSVGAGGPRLTLTNEHGTIEIHKGSTVAQAPNPPRGPKAPNAPEAPEPTEN
jgi:DUF4097 and DUF4098 domain-containing protein YvlB